MKTVNITLNNITYKVTYKWSAFLQDVDIKKIIAPIGSPAFDFNKLRAEVLHIELTRNHDRISMVQEEREEEARYPSDGDAMVDGISSE